MIYLGDVYRFPRFVNHAITKARERNLDVSDPSNILLGSIEADNRKAGAVV